MNEDPRVTIAKDVLLQLDTRKISAEHGTYVSFMDTVKEADHPEHVQLQEVLQKAAHCNVCAIGAVFVAAVLRHDKLTLRSLLGEEEEEGNGSVTEMDNVHPTAIITYLSEFFSEKQLRMMEAFFEGFCRYNNELDDVILKFYRSSYTSERRLRKIMENVIQHGGDFVVPGFTYDDVVFDSVLDQ